MIVGDDHVSDTETAVQYENQEKDNEETLAPLVFDRNNDRGSKSQQDQHFCGTGE